MARNNKTSETLFQFMNHLITLLHQNGQHRTMQHYKATLNSFKRYRANRDIALRDLSAEEMRSYEAHLKNVSKVCSNTSFFYLRTLRATYNKAVEQRLTPQKHPFRNVYTGIAKTRKRAIPTASISKIKHLAFPQDLTHNQEFARDTFLLCFYLRGISFIDLAPPPQVRPPRRLSPLHPKQDRPTPYRPLGEGDAALVRQISKLQHHLPISLSPPCRHRVQQPDKSRCQQARRATPLSQRRSPHLLPPQAVRSKTWHP